MWGKVLLRGLQGESGYPVEGREHVELPGAWLLQAVEPEPAECPGSGQPPDFREGNWF